jgi:dihydroneopterin aldolase
MDMIQIKALSVNTHIGIHAWEQRILQVLRLDIDLHIDLSTCHNELKNTIDYDQICQRVTAFIESQCFTLIETVAEQVAQLIKKEFCIDQISVRVSKPHAIKNASDISVTVHR